MAKKKPTHVTHHPNQPDPQTHPSQNPSKMAENQQKNSSKMAEEASPPMAAAAGDPHPPPPSVAEEKEKLSNLKALNAKLLSETLQNRQEIKGLLSSKESLEGELTRSESEVDSLKAELTRSEVAREVVSVFVESQVVGSLEKKLQEVEREMAVVSRERDEVVKMKVEGDLKIGSMKKLEEQLRTELTRATRERTELTQQLGVRVEEVGRLKEKVAEVEEKEMSVVKELRGVKSKLEVSTKEVEELRKEREENNVRISELEKEVNELNGVVSRGKEDEEKWRARFIELEKSNAGVASELKEVKRDFGSLLKEKKEKEREIERLMGEKSRVEARLDEVEELRGAKRGLGEVVDEKVRLEEVKLRQEGEISELECELNEIRGDLLSLRELNRECIEKNEKLAEEVEEYKSGFERVSKERDGVKKSLDEEKKNGMKLQGRVSDISKKMEETAKVIDNLRAVSDSVVGEKKEIESKYSKLVEDKGLVEKEFGAAKGKIEQLEASMKAKTEMFELALAMLRDTVVQLSKENESKSEGEGVKANERGINGELEPILAELDAMRSVFKRREEKVGEIQKQMESLQCSVMEARKKKNFWTLVSSATTILAAVVSYAYASRVR